MSREKIFIIIKRCRLEVARRQIEINKLNQFFHLVARLMKHTKNANLFKSHDVQNVVKRAMIRLKGNFLSYQQQIIEQHQHSNSN